MRAMSKILQLEKSHPLNSTEKAIKPRDLKIAMGLMNAFNRTNFIDNSDSALFINNHTYIINTNNFHYLAFSATLFSQQALLTSHRIWARIV